jgi:DNA-binding MarR family transcriptional regulator
VTRANKKTDGHDSKESDGPSSAPLGAALRRAWVGYQLLLEEEMATAGVSRRHFPDGRVLHICAQSPDTTISEIGRELEITRQGASKLVGVLMEQGMVTLAPSPTDGREKLVRLTRTATTYLDTQRKGRAAVDRRLRAQVGDDAIEALFGLLERLGSRDTPRLHAFLRTRSGAMHLE